jgi:hypothetical protein
MAQELQIVNRIQCQPSSVLVGSVTSSRSAAIRKAESLLSDKPKVVMFS